MSGEDSAARVPLLPPEEWSPSEDALRTSVLRTISLLREVSGESASLQEWVEYRMANEVRFIKNAREHIVLQQITTSSSASTPIAAPEDSYLGQERGTNNEHEGPQHVWPQMEPLYDDRWLGAAGLVLLTAAEDDSDTEPCSQVTTAGPPGPLRQQHIPGQCAESRPGPSVRRCGHLERGWC